ncbi:TolC family protein [Novosphingobium umbonatum]|nr:TolC family protein [Novosphingobium umbonatum]
MLIPTLAMGSAAWAEPLTFQTAVEKATEQAPAILAGEAGLRASRASAVAAGQLPDPSVSVGIDNFPISGPPAFRPGQESMTMARVGIEQAFPNPAKRQAERTRAFAAIGTAQAGAAVSAQEVRLNAAVAWIDLYYAKRRLAQLQGLDASLNDLQATVTARLSSGTARPSQAYEPDQLRAAINDRRAQLEAEVTKAQARLASLTGDTAADVIGDLPIFEIDREDLRAHLSETPRLAALDADVTAANAETDMARAAKRPDWRVSTSYGHRAPVFGDMVSVGVSIDLPLFARKRQDPLIAAREAEAERARLNRVAGERDLGAALSSDLADYDMHRRQLNNARVTLVPLAKRRAELDMASYAAGKLDLGSALLSSLALAEAEVDALTREADVARDAVRITYTYREGRP